MTDFKKNAKDGWISTVIGIVIILSAITSVFIPDLNIDWTGAGVGMAVGIGLIGFGKK